MDEGTKSAYRYVIYWAMLQIRGLSWLGYKPIQSANPFYWWCQRKRIRAAGETAEWLHNAAAFSAHDFAGFSEERFWKEYESLRAKFPHQLVWDFRNIFDNRLHECRTGKWPSIEEQKQREAAGEQSRSNEST